MLDKDVLINNCPQAKQRMKNRLQKAIQLIFEQGGELAEIWYIAAIAQNTDKGNIFLEDLVKIVCQISIIGDTVNEMQKDFKKLCPARADWITNRKNCKAGLPKLKEICKTLAKIDIAELT